ncbi:hypothetical protein [Microbacterium sp. CIAB417]|uniref:hypothetical protein n=1 Tax=Microbacterium sp. CIAB417 TaxID=2860287 RepID=UPI001FAC0543|nr:hypothetical protein [Microbacterium sp. CIAB417]
MAGFPDLEGYRANGRILPRTTRRSHPFWDSEEGERYRDFRRPLDALHLAVDIEAPSKNVRGGRTPAYRAALAADGARSSVARRATRFSRWPKPRAPLTLDLHFSFASRQPPRVDVASKALLDLLGKQSGPPIAYADDRQIKLLFAHGHSHLNGRAHTRVQARSLGDVTRAIRRASEIEPRWDPFRRTDLLMEEWGIDADWDWDPEWRLRGDVDTLSKRQSLFLSIADRASWRVTQSLADELTRRRVVAWTTDAALTDLAKSRLAVDLGRLPRQGESAAFRERLQFRLADMARSSIGVFPLLPAVGVTVFYVESEQPRDLDNIHRTILKDVLTILRPPEESVSTWSSMDTLREWDEARRGERPWARTGVTFIEAAAIPAKLAPNFEPGTAVLALSQGSRYRSWWDDAYAHIARVAEADYNEEEDLEWD